MGLATKLAKAGAKKAGKSSTPITELIKSKSSAKAKEIDPQDITEYIKTTLVPKKESTKNFNAKFKDTTIVDEKNNPRVMYHGRNKDFESFDTTNTKTKTQEIGTHIGTADQANEFATREGGNVVPAYLDVKNPLRLNDYGSFDSSEVLEQLRSRGDFDEDLIDEIEDIPSIIERNKAVVNLIKDSGYDGIVYLNKREGLNLKGTDKQKSAKIDELQDYDDETLMKKYGAKDSYIIFDPAQAKSVFNKGTWSGSDDRLNYNKGGTVNDMNKLFAEGGMNDEGGTVDPVSGNDVPPGSLQNEVRDDIPAKLSEGEFVIPADVVRYIGLERLMKLRDEAKQGLSRMAEIGQMGNADQVENPEALHESGEDFESEIDDIMKEVDGEAMGEKNFAAGGYAEPGVDLLSKYNVPRTSLTNPALDVRAYKNKQGRVMYITFFNGKPSIAIPQGYEYISSAGQLLAENKTELTKINAPTIDMGGYGGDGGDGGGSSGGSSAASDSAATDGNVANSATGMAAPANQSIAEVDMGTMSAAAAAEAAAAASMAESAAATATDDASTSEGVSDGSSSSAGPGGSSGESGAADAGAGPGGPGDGAGEGDGGASGGGGGGAAGDGGDGGGDGFAKGGLVAKRPKKPTASGKRGLASKK